MKLLGGSGGNRRPSGARHSSSERRSTPRVVKQSENPCRLTDAPGTHSPSACSCHCCSHPRSPSALRSRLRSRLLRVLVGRRSELTGSAGPILDAHPGDPLFDTLGQHLIAIQSLHLARQEVTILALALPHQVEELR